MKRQVVNSMDDLDRLERQIQRSVDTTAGLLKTLLQSRDTLEFFARLKFTEAGRDPLDCDRTLNVVEQLNQTFTYLATIGGARWIISNHPDCQPLVLNLGTASGFDIQSQCGRFVAETFAVTHPRSNDKLRKDISKIQQVAADHRFVFYISRLAPPPVAVPGVTVVRLEFPVLAALNSDA